MPTASWCGAIATLLTSIRPRRLQHATNDLRSDRNIKTTYILAGLLGLVAAAPSLGANIILNNVDVAGVGFNDATLAAPVGGNAGTTVGAQRLIAYRKALELWGKTLRSDVTVVVQGSFAGLPCTATGGTLAQAGAITIFASFPGAPLPNHWYGAALANSIVGDDLTPGGLDPGPLADLVVVAVAGLLQ